MPKLTLEEAKQLDELIETVRNSDLDEQSLLDSLEARFSDSVLDAWTETTLALVAHSS